MNRQAQSSVVRWVSDQTITRRAHISVHLVTTLYAWLSHVTSTASVLPDLMRHESKGPSARLPGYSPVFRLSATHVAGA